MQTMLAAEKDEVVRARYQQEIGIFEQALEVQKGMNAYTEKNFDIRYFLTPRKPCIILSR